MFNPQKFFRDEGFVRFDSVDFNNEILALEQFFCESLAKSLVEVGRGEASVSGFEEGRLVLSLLRQYPEEFGKFYDKLKLSNALKSIFLSSDFGIKVAEVLGCKPWHLGTLGEMFRIDFPEDTKRRLGWHQDNAYYQLSRNSDAGAVVWIPLHEVDEVDGTLQIIRGSHHSGLRDPSWISTADESAERIELEISESDCDAVEHLVAKTYSLNLLHLNLVHSSGFNRSELPRLTIGVRVFDLSDSQFCGGTVTFSSKLNGFRERA